MKRIPADERYAHHGGTYHRVRSCENLETSVVAALERVARISGAEVVEMGAGSGPVTQALLSRAHYVWAYDQSAHMVETARQLLVATGHSNWSVATGDHRKLPHPGASADVAVAAFTLGPMVTSERDGDWRGALDAAVSEMLRVLRVGGIAAVFEATWTWVEPPDGLIEHPWFRATAERLETEHGFRCLRFRSDIDFSPLREEPELLEMVFGTELTARIKEGNWVMPQGEGMWWRTK